jgi:hypothetical protein
MSLSSTDSVSCPKQLFEELLREAFAFSPVTRRIIASCSLSPPPISAKSCPRAASALHPPSALCPDSCFPCPIANVPQPIRTELEERGRLEATAFTIVDERLVLERVPELPLARESAQPPCLAS